MILVTIGTQLPFDRLINYIESWVVNSAMATRVVAQVGTSSFRSENIIVLTSVEPDKFEKYISEAELIVSHAGMGSILTALRVRKPIIIVPRDASLGEHRNDHQLATARSFNGSQGVYVANNEYELCELLDNRKELACGALNESSEYKKLLANIWTMISV